MIDPQLPHTDPQHLLAAAAAGELPLTTPLPAGRLVGSRAADGDAPPVLWLSDGPATAGLWAALHSERHRTGLWPLLLLGLDDTPAFRPWQSQELSPQDMSSADEHDAAVLLKDWWAEVAAWETDDPEEAEERQELVAPFGPVWPGLAPAPTGGGDPDATARSVATQLLRARPGMRIGLVPATDGAQALATCGWSGPLNHEADTGKIASVLRSWEHRFGAQVVGAGFDTLYLSVAAPPTSPDSALLIAAEHLALCPDNILQGDAETLAEYADDLVDEDLWALWWD
ncbi:DUF4253 domain-containing protein [Kitasatospora sp. NPDC058965]|uniref:DUF4253 domain-containing protein n=1 Tax=Kitasatospora sp. NPDC058965 TaxID=3346682 RepID=UPI0036B72604